MGLNLLKHAATLYKISSFQPFKEKIMLKNKNSLNKIRFL